jgi:hypothetical protein
MSRRSHILTVVAVLVACAALVPSAYAVYGPATPAQSTDQGSQDLRSPDARDAAEAAATQPDQYVYSSDPDSSAARTQAPGGNQVAQDLRSPDARDAGRTPVEVPTPVVEVREVPSSGFDWGDAGIGAAGILALLSIAGGLTLMATSRRRGPEMPAH